MIEALARANDRLHAALLAAEIPATREPDGIRLGEADIRVAVEALWDNPAAPAPDEAQTFGVQFAITAPALFGETAYEFSYGWGETEAAAAASAFARWVELDLPVLRDACAGTAEHCVMLEMTANEANGAAPGTWRIYLGPLHYVAGAAGAEPCCQTCLLAMSMPFLHEVLSRPVSSAIKIVASRHEDGTGSADCRRNGHDLPDAIDRIAATAAATWPGSAGTQSRRQYIYFQAPPS